MNTAIGLGIVYLFGGLMYLFHTFVPDLAPEWFQRLSYFLLAILCGSLAYDVLIGIQL